VPITELWRITCNTLPFRTRDVLWPWTDLHGIYHALYRTGMFNDIRQGWIGYTLDNPTCEAW
jgi:hypothetical protein